MNRAAAAASAAFLAAVGLGFSPARGQGGRVVDCWDCTLAIWADEGLTNYCTGRIETAVPLAFYIGIDSPAHSETGFTEVEFSIAGMRMAEDGILLLSFEPRPGGIYSGSLPAPADTTATSTGTGGVVIAWPGCQTDRRLDLDRPLRDPELRASIQQASPCVEAICADEPAREDAPDRALRYAESHGGSCSRRLLRAQSWELLRM